jgi:hypothetical protein
MQRCSQQQQLGHVVEKLESFLNHFKSLSTFTLVNTRGRLFEIFICSGLLNAQKLDYFIMVRVDLVCGPKALVSILKPIHGPH